MFLKIVYQNTNISCNRSAKIIYLQSIMAIKLNWDAMGVVTSVACAIHCAILPVIMSSLPIFGINIIHNSMFEWGMIGFAFLVGSYALFHGFLKHHRSLVPVLIFTFGFIFLILKQFFESTELWFLFVAVCSIVSAHFYNYRLCHRSKCSSPHHAH